MNAQPQLGAILVVLGGLLQGSFALPMKRLGKWRWENIWLVYSVAGLLIVPSILALATVPGLGGIYGSASMGTLALVALFGFGWGLGSTLFGQGISRVGFALGFAVILGVTSVLGSLLPLLINDPSKIATTQGLYLIAGIVLAVVGIICCAIAGAMREKATKTATDAAAGESGFTTGLIICIAAGILSPMLNFAFVYGKPLTDAGLANGANPTQASNSIWVLGLAAGFIPNAGYAIYLLAKNKTWGLFKANVGTNYWLGASLMGLIWYGGIAVYGMGAGVMGELGAVVGWPVFMSMNIVTANVIGALTGEWAGTSGRTRGISWLGIAILLAAITVISLGPK